MSYVKNIVPSMTSENLHLGVGVLERVGNTPLLRLERVVSDYPHVGFFAKAEWFNPGGSVKDRAALSMIREGERAGALARRARRSSTPPAAIRALPTP